MKMTELEDLLLKEVAYKDWMPNLKNVYDLLGARIGWLFHWSFAAPDNTDPSSCRLELQKGRQWFIPDGATRTNVINTLYLAAEIAERHEFMECFTVGGRILRDPHTEIPEIKETI